MSELWQVSIMTAVLAVMTAILGRISNTLSGLRQDLNKKVDKEDCSHDMDYHCNRLDRLEQDVRANTADIISHKADIAINAADIATLKTLAAK